MAAGSRIAWVGLLLCLGVFSRLWAQPVLLPPEINTEFDELGPLLTADGNTLYFSRRNHPQNFGQRNAEDIWVAYQQPDGSWSRAVNAGAPLNGRGNNRLVGVNPNETHYYFLADALPDTVAHVPGLFLSKREGRSLGAPEPVVIADFVNLAPKADFHLGPEEQVMIMAIRREDSYGVRDLYLSHRQPDDTWGPPRNLGPVVNSGVDEGSPFLAADRRSLYFCRQVAGSLTFYVSRRTDESWTNWTPPERIPLPELNGSPGPNFALTAAGDALILPVIDRSGQFDLYQLPLEPSFRPQPVALVRGRVLLPLDAPPETPDLLFHPAGETPPPTSRIALRQDNQFSILASYGRNMVLYAEAPPYFNPAECLNLGAEPCQVLDRDQSRAMEELLSMPEYVERESEISDLFRRQQRTFQILNDLQTRIYDFENLSFVDLPATILDSVLESNSELQELANAYQSYFPKPSLTIKGVPAPRRPEEEDEQKKRFQMLRQRFRERHTSRRDTLLPPVMAAPQLVPETFAAFCSQLWALNNQQLTPVLRSSLEKEELTLQLENLRSSRGTPQGLITFLEHHLQSAAPKAEVLEPRVRIIYPESWLEELRTKAEPILRDALMDGIGAKLKPVSASHVDELIQEYRKSREYTTLDQEFRNRLEQQMILERNVMERYRNSSPPAPPSPPATSPPPSFQIIERSLTFEEVVPNTKFLLPVVTFEPNAYAIKPSALPELDRLVALLEREPHLSARILVHTHGYMTHLRARQLTNARAQKVAEYLASRGIASRRLLPEGVGKMDPLVSNTTQEGRTRNQRLEILLLYPEE